MLTRAGIVVGVAERDRTGKVVAGWHSTKDKGIVGCNTAAAAVVGDVGAAFVDVEVREGEARSAENDGEGA